MFDLPVSEDMTCPFRDLGPDDPSTLYPNDYVAAAYRAGLIRGTTATAFSPWQTVTRGQAISLVVRHVLKQYPESLPWPPAGGYEYDLSDEYPSVHNDNIRVAFYNGLLGGVETGDGGWNPWWEIKRAEVAQILVNARQHTTAAPKPTRNFYAQGPSIKSLEELNAYLAQQKALLAQLVGRGAGREGPWCASASPVPSPRRSLPDWKPLTAWSRPPGTRSSSTRASAEGPCGSAPATG